jgi:mannosyltransferase
MAGRQIFNPLTARRFWLAVALLGLATGLFFGYLRLFNNGHLAGVFSRRQVLDGLSLAVIATLGALYLFVRPAARRTNMPRVQPLRWRWVLPLVLLILVGAYLRLHKLDSQSLWRDELASVARVDSATLPDALMLGNWQDAWPSYHIPVYGFIRLAGDSEFALRFPSALAGIVLIPILFVLGRRAFSAREGLIAAGLVLALKAPVAYSQEMRSYAFMMVYAALSVYLWLRMAQEIVWKGKPSRFSLVGYTASAILLIYSHYFGLALLVVEGVGALALMVHMRRIPPSLVAAFGAIGLAYVPWIPLMVSDLGKRAFWAGKPHWFGGDLYRYFLFVFHRPLLPIAIALGVICFAVTLWQSIRRRDRGQALPLIITPGVVLMAWLILPYSLAYWRSVTATPILVNRYLLVSLPAAFLLVARGIGRLPVARTLRGLAGAGLVVFLITRFAAGSYYTAPSKTQIRQAVQYIASHEGQFPDAVIVGGYQGGQHELDYYFRKFGSSSTVTIKAGNTWQIDDVRSQLAALHPHYIWFLGQHLFYEKEFEDFLAHDFTRRLEVPYWHMTVFLYENPSAP